MNWEEAYPGKYLQSVSLLGKTVTTVITGVRKELVENPRTNTSSTEVVLDLYKVRKMVCNKTNAKAVAMKTNVGEPGEAWIGTVVTLYAQKGTWFGEEGTAVRIRKGPEKVIPFLEEADSLQELEIRHNMLGPKSNINHVNKLIEQWKKKK